MVDWAGGAGFDTQPGEENRAVVTILFTAIVDSTVKARNGGDVAWKRTLSMHNDVVRSVLVGFGGSEIKYGWRLVLDTFDGAERLPPQGYRARARVVRCKVNQIVK